MNIETLNEDHEEACTADDLAVFMLLLKSALRNLNVIVLDDIKGSKQTVIIDGKTITLLSKARFTVIDKNDIKGSAERVAAEIREQNPIAIAFQTIGQVIGSIGSDDEKIVCTILLFDLIFELSENHES